MSDWKDNSFKVSKFENLEKTSGSFTSGRFWNVGDTPATLTVTPLEGASKGTTVPLGGAIEFPVGIVKSIAITSGTVHVG